MRGHVRLLLLYNGAVGASFILYGALVLRGVAFHVESKSNPHFCSRRPSDADALKKRSRITKSLRRSNWCGAQRCKHGAKRLRWCFGELPTVVPSPIAPPPTFRSTTHVLVESSIGIEIGG
jgi:hypothetical protein